MNRMFREVVADPTYTYDKIKECMAFKAWLKSAKPRDNYTYYVGASLFDQPYVFKVKQLVWSFAVTGDVYLVQKKIGLDKYQYIAQKSEHRIAALIPLKSTSFEHPYK